MKKTFSLHSAVSLLTVKKGTTPRQTKKTAAIQTMLPFTVIVQNFIWSLYKPTIFNEPTQSLEDLSFPEFLMFLVRCSLYFDPFNPVSTEEQCAAVVME
mmetsp:Transcript_12483/g.19505  ORF Transcript_12483/g.19505 Transcript_12483/m.19505 type:complete len:99 (+) Transcript_12483:1390-1686(+)